MSAFATVSYTISGIKERRQKVTAEKLTGKSTLRLGLGPLVIEEFLVLVICSASAKRKVILIRRVHAILESLYFPVHLFERICVRLIFHHFHPRLESTLYCISQFVASGSNLASGKLDRLIRVESRASRDLALRG
jgi:hypothetical protein